MDKTSLGVVRPRNILDLEVERDDEEWSESARVSLAQMTLFADPPQRLERIPFRFKYRFQDQDGAEHRLTIRDWELGVLFLKMREDHGEAAAVEKVRQKYLDQMCAPNKDLRLFVGTMYPYNQWLCVGVFWPPKVETKPQFRLDL